MKFQMFACDADNPEGWREIFDKAGVLNQADAEEAARTLIENFNNTLRDGELPRTLISVVFLGNDRTVEARRLEDKGEDHDWNKASLVTEQGGFDRMRCVGCGITGKRYGVAGVKRDSEFGAKAFRFCDTSRALLTRRNGRVSAGRGKR